jgi:hypothetical protein
MLSVTTSRGRSSSNLLDSSSLAMVPPSGSRFFPERLARTDIRKFRSNNEPSKKFRFEDLGVSKPLCSTHFGYTNALSWLSPLATYVRWTKERMSTTKTKFSRKTRFKFYTVFDDEKAVLCSRKYDSRSIGPAKFNAIGHYLLLCPIRAQFRISVTK